MSLLDLKWYEPYGRAEEPTDPDIATTPREDILQLRDLAIAILAKRGKRKRNPVFEDGKFTSGLAYPFAYCFRYGIDGLWLTYEGKSPALPPIREPAHDDCATHMLFVRCDKRDVMVVLWDDDAGVLIKNFTRGIWQERLIELNRGVA